MSRTKLVRRPLLVAAVATAFAIAGSIPSVALPVEAQSPSGGVDVVSSCTVDPTEPVPTSMKLVDGQHAAAATRVALSAVRGGEVLIQAPRSALIQGQAKVYTVESGHSIFTSVTVPIGGRYSLLSNLTVLLDDTGEIAQYSETLYTENSDGNFHMESYADGDLVISRDTDIAFMTDAELRLEMNDSPANGDVGTLGFWSTVACVGAVLGVSGTVAYLIVGVCTGACAVPGVGTAVCVACIGAYATVGGASIAAVASCFK